MPKTGSAKSSRRIPPLQDDRLCAQGFRCDVNSETGETRLVLTREPGQIIAYIVLKPSSEVYDMASQLLSCYDEIEGLK